MVNSCTYLREKSGTARTDFPYNCSLRRICSSTWNNRKYLRKENWKYASGIYLIDSSHGCRVDCNI